MEGECGEYSLAWGYWDYCLYKDSSKPDYVDLDWKIKHDMIWAEIKADPSFGAYHPTDLFTESVVTSFENEWDVMPAGRVKVLIFSLGQFLATYFILRYGLNYTSNFLN